jgi:hypothetical protein
MEDVLDVYHRPPDARFPVVGLDEKPVPLVADVREPAPAAPGRPARRDYEYERRGSANVFCAFDPHAGHRRLAVTARRTRVDFARFVRDVVDDPRYAGADRVVVVLDNLNTHTLASLYEAFPAAEARRVAARLELHYTPKHGSWLNVAEVELSVLGRRLPDRVPDAESLARHVAVVEAEQNARRAGCDWQFTTADARVKLKRLYPIVE